MTGMELLLTLGLLFTSGGTINGYDWDKVVSDVIESQKEEDKVYKNYKEESGLFELPLYGATGYTADETWVLSQPQEGSLGTVCLAPGTAFTVLYEQGDWWMIQTGVFKGWVNHNNCMLNIPDVLPSIVFDNKNAYSSAFTSMGREIVGVTGEAFYDTINYNERFDENTFDMPAMYNTVKLLAKAQEAALANGDTLIIVETYRPSSTQAIVVSGLQKLMNADSSVKTAINSWGIDWFMGTGVSSHQQGISVDISLGQVVESTKQTTGDFEYTKITSYVEHEMPTKIHELSPAAASMAYPVSTLSKTEWQSAELAPAMNTPALRLRKYCTDAGLTPMSSAWWQFNDLSATRGGNGGYYTLDKNASTVPV